MSESPNNWMIVGVDGEEGPFAPSELKAMAADSTLSRDALLKRMSDGKTMKAYRVRGLFPNPPSPTKPPSLPTRDPRVTALVVAMILLAIVVGIFAIDYWQRSQPKPPKVDHTKGGNYHSYYR